MELGRTELKPLSKLDGEKYRKHKVRDVWKKNGLATLGFGLIAGAIMIGMMIVAVDRSKMILAGVFYGGVLMIGVGAYILLWLCALRNVKNKKYDDVAPAPSPCVHFNDRPDHQHACARRADPA